MTPAPGMRVTALVGTELRRYLARRLTRVLIGVAVLGSVVAGVVVFANTETYDATEAAARREQRIESCVASFRSGPRGPVAPGRVPSDFGGPAPGEAEVRETCAAFAGSAESEPGLRLTELWSPGGGDAVWIVTSVFLGIGALIGAASMVGAEWKANTFTTLLTWEPRRVRVAVVKLVVAGLLAVVVAIALQLFLALALLPTISAKGTTDGADAEWFRTAAAGLGRSGLLAGLAAVVGGAVAMIGRSTSAALGAAFAYLAIVEAVLRAWKPLQARWLLSENAAIFLTGRRLDSVPFDRPVAMAWITLIGYAAALVALAAVTFRRRDVAA